MRRRFTLDEARAIQAARLREREHRFLHFVERAVFARPTSVLSKLFEHAGVPFQDLRELVLVRVSRRRSSACSRRGCT
jgi:hypothetical protein